MFSFSPPNAFIHADAGKIALDRKGPVSFISHAHADHLPKALKGSRVIASPQTLELIRNASKANGFTLVDAAEFDAELLNAGHVLGSAQLRVNADGRSFTYAGDVCLCDSLVLKGAETKQADELLIESTYGLPEFVFPKREQIYEEIAAWVENERRKGKNVVLGGYSLGKAQELIAVLNKYCGIAPVVNNEVHSVSGIYKKHGVKLDLVHAQTDEGASLLKHGFTAVLPQHLVSFALAKKLEENYCRGVSTAVATGWSMSNFSLNVNAGFCLSGHADFNELLEFVERVAPKRVYATHGYAREFSKELRKRGFDAVAIEKADKQKTLVC